MKLIYNWTQTKDYEYRLFAGPYAVAEVFHHAPKPLDRAKPWMVQVLLPGIEVRKDLRFADQDEAKEVAEKSVTHWFNSALRDN